MTAESNKTVDNKLVKKNQSKIKRTWLGSVRTQVFHYSDTQNFLNKFIVYSLSFNYLFVNK
jgi:hypothetical protein